MHMSLCVVPTDLASSVVTTNSSRSSMERSEVKTLLTNLIEASALILIT
jgi:hypothetical protein